MKEINLFEPPAREDIQKPETVSSKPSSPKVSPPKTPFAKKPEMTLLDLIEKQDIRLQVRRVIEALLFASSEPLSLDRIREVTDTLHPLPPRDIRALIQVLQDEYYMQKRAFRIEETAQSFVLRSSEEYHPYIEQLYRNKRGEKLSNAATEVLAIIAYRQPITKPQMEAIRGVDCTGVVQALLERQLIQPVGRLEAPGRPTLFGTTKEFLHHFGLRDVGELPPLALSKTAEKIVVVDESLEKNGNENASERA